MASLRGRGVQSKDLQYRVFFLRFTEAEIVLRLKMNERSFALDVQSNARGSLDQDDGMPQ